MKRIISILVILCTLSALSYAQTDRKPVRKGNKEFRKEKYEESEISYKKALLADSTSATAAFVSL